MSDVTEAGLDRRSLIKKGLVAGGVIATVPVISTFNAPAAAFSPPGFRIRIDIPLDLNLLALTISVGAPQRVDTTAPSDTGCPSFEADWDAALPDPGDDDIPISVAGSVEILLLVVISSAVTFTLGPTTPAGLVFAGGRRAGLCTPGVIGGGGTTITFPLPLISIALSDTYYFVVN